jgi:hypothetical protein
MKEQTKIKIKDEPTYSDERNKTILASTIIIRRLIYVNTAKKQGIITSLLYMVFRHAKSIISSCS